MKSILIRTLTLTLALLLCLPLAACKNAADKVVTTTAQSDPTEEKPAELDKELKIDIMVLSGTTGVGIAPMINDVKNGTAALNYNIEVASSAGTQVVEDAHLVFALTEFCDMAADKSAASGNENSIHSSSFTV